MRNTLAIARKELGTYCTTPSAYVVVTAMVALTSFFFTGMLQQFQLAQEYARQVTWARLPPDWQIYRNLTDGVMVQLWGSVIIIILFVAPFLSMRLLAEEKRQKTFELLMTTPLRPVEIVLGKYLGGVGMMSASLAFTLAFPLVLSALGTSDAGSVLEWSTVLLGFGALLLWGATCMAVGLFMSAMTQSPMLAAFLTFAVLLPWMLLKNLAQSAEEPLRSVINHVAFDAQLQSFMLGIVDLKSLVFFASVIGFALFLTHRAVEGERWR